MSPKSSEDTMDLQSKEHDVGHPRNASQGKKSLRFREFKVRDSLMTTLFENNENVQAVVSIVSGFVWFHVVIMVLFNRQQLKEDYAFFHWSLIRNFHLFAVMWFGLFALYVINYFNTKLFINKLISSTVYWILTLLTIGLSVMVCHYEPWTFKSQLSNSLMMALLCEHVRIEMKVLAYAFHSTKKADVENKNDEDNKGHKQGKSSLSHYIYFFFAPCMVYRDYYPRSAQPTNWKRVIQYFVHFIGTVYLLLMGLRHLVQPYYSRVGKVPMTSADIGHLILVGYWFGLPIFLFGMAHALLHCWHNIFAEIIHFGDRHFYNDWWTVTNSIEYLRKWNLIVGDWIFEYVHVPLMNKTRSRFFSALMIYNISAILHDYVLYGILGFFLPLYTLVYPTLAIIGDFSFMYIKRLGLFNNASRLHGNTVFHMFSYACFAIWIGISSLEYYSRMNCPDKLEGTWKEALGLSPLFPKCITFQ